MKNYQDYGISEEQYALLLKFHAVLDVFSDEMMYLPAQKIISDSRWQGIREMAKEVLKAFNYPQTEMWNYQMHINNILVSFKWRTVKLLINLETKYFQKLLKLIFQLMNLNSMEVINMSLSEEAKKQIMKTLLETIADVTDEEYQQRVWIEGRGPECDDFDEFVNYFLHESRVFWKNIQSLELLTINIKY